jgi:hypothetical protein
MEKDSVAKALPTERLRQPPQRRPSPSSGLRVHGIVCSLNLASNHQLVGRSPRLLVSGKLDATSGSWSYALPRRQRGHGIPQESEGSSGRRFCGRLEVETSGGDHLRYVDHSPQELPSVVNHYLQQTMQSHLYRGNRSTIRLKLEGITAQARVRRLLSCFSAHTHPTLLVHTQPCDNRTRKAHLQRDSIRPQQGP